MGSVSVHSRVRLMHGACVNAFLPSTTKRTLTSTSPPRTAVDLHGGPSPSTSETRYVFLSGIALPKLTHISCLTNPTGRSQHHIAKSSLKRPLLSSPPNHKCLGAPVPGQAHLWTAPYRPQPKVRPWAITMARAPARSRRCRLLASRGRNLSTREHLAMAASSVKAVPGGSSRLAAPDLASNNLGPDSTAGHITRLHHRVPRSWVLSPSNPRRHCHKARHSSNLNNRHSNRP